MKSLNRHCNACWRRQLQQIAADAEEAMHPEDAAFLWRAVRLIDELQPDCPDCAEIKAQHAASEVQP